MHFVRIKNKEPKYNNGLPIHRQIICGGRINLCNLYKMIKNPYHRAIAFNTDSIMMRKIITKEKITNDKVMPDDIISEEKYFNSFNNVLSNIGKYRIEDWKIRGSYYKNFEDRTTYKYESVKWIIEKEHDDFAKFCTTIDEQQSALISGGAGCGKTEIIKRIRNDTDLILCFTNKAVELVNL